MGIQGIASRPCEKPVNIERMGTEVYTTSTYPSRSEYEEAVSRILKSTFAARIDALLGTTYCVGTIYDSRMLGLKSHI